MGLRRIGARGQLTMPRAVRDVAGIKPGDRVSVEAVGPGKIVIRALAYLTPADLLEIYPIEGPVDIARDRREWEAEAAGEVLGKYGG